MYYQQVMWHETHLKYRTPNGIHYFLPQSYLTHPKIWYLTQANHVIFKIRKGFPPKDKFHTTSLDNDWRLTNGNNNLLIQRMKIQPKYIWQKTNINTLYDLKILWLKCWTQIKRAIWYLQQVRLLSTQIHKTKTGGAFYKTISNQCYIMILLVNKTSRSYWVN